ncbi:MAG: MFS transporter [Rhodospirillales bacterium]|nr:MFS transporter [Rhodospirillales bacterium]
MRDNDRPTSPLGTGRSERRKRAVRRAGFGLDWLNLFVANVQTGFGPFLAVYLTTAGWTQTSIGVALSIGTITAMASQVPAGAVVDAVRRKTRVAVFSILAFTASALLFTIQPIPLFVYLGQMLHAFSSCTLGPAIVAMSLAVAGQAALGTRLGRNARFAAIGTGVGAALMGACGYYISERAVFYLTAILTFPAVAALVPLAGVADRRLRSVPPPRQDGGKKLRLADMVRALSNRRLLTFAACATLFTFANAAMLPLAGGAITKRASEEASLLIAACIVIPQIVVALISPSVGRMAEVRGRKIVLLLGFSILPIRGVLLALIGDPAWVVLVQALDGIAGACFGVMMPLVTTDIAARTGHLNRSLGFVGFSVGIGATLSTTIAGFIADTFGEGFAFFGLGAVGLLAVLLVLTAMEETRPEDPDPGSATDE